MEFQNSLAFARQADSQFASSSYRSRFKYPQHNGKEAIYFLGNSLGLPPRATENALQGVMNQWSDLGVESFFKGENPWLDFHSRLQPALGKVVGALPEEIVVMNSLTVNLHLLLVSFYQPTTRRNKIICEAKAFPSDQYMLHSHVKQRGLIPEDTIIEVAPREGEVLIREEDIKAAITQHQSELALVFWGGVNYYTGQVFDIKSITEWTHEAGALVGFDLAHAAGNVPLFLHNWNVDFAGWCSYKYLNAGPGGMGGVFIHQRYHHDQTLNRFAGWWGHEKETQFLMRQNFTPETSAAGWQLSTPSPFLYAAHQTSLEIFDEAGAENVFAANQKLNDFLWFVLDAIRQDLPEDALTIFTPRATKAKGCQVSLQVKNGKKVFDALTQQGVFADWREPDVIRIAPVSFYNTFEEAWRFGDILKTAIISFAL